MSITQAEKNTATILQQFHQPAFLVRDGVIICVNSAAAERFIPVGEPIGQLLSTGAQQYQQFQSGSLYLTVCVCGTEHPCLVTALEDTHLFTLQGDYENTSLQSLSLAAQQLNIPLSELSLLINQLPCPDADKKNRITQNIYKLRRILGNMADASGYATACPKLSNCDICSVFREILEKAAVLLKENAITVTYTLPEKPIYTLANQELLKRALYNLLSNGAKFSPWGDRVHAQVQHQNDLISVTVTGGSSAVAASGQNLFNRYHRSPSLEDRQYGLGLGMSIIHSAAIAHNGTVLIHQDSDGFRITMTLSVRRGNDGQIRSPILVPDVYGGMDQALVELSDVLSPNQYQNN